MQRGIWTILLVAGMGGALWLGRAPSSAPPAAASPALPDAVSAAPAPEPAAPPSPAASGPVPESQAPSAPSIGDDAAKRLLEDETVRDRLYRLALEEEARQRFDASLEHSGITAEEIEDGVKRLFETARVEPVLEREGRMDGMVLRSLNEGHPLHRAGFREGDRLTRLDDWALDDAGTLPDILIRLRRSFVACAVVNGIEREVCREVTVDAG